MNEHPSDLLLKTSKIGQQVLIRQSRMVQSLCELHSKLNKDQKAFVSACPRVGRHWRRWQTGASGGRALPAVMPSSVWRFDHFRFVLRVSRATPQGLLPPSYLPPIHRSVDQRVERGQDLLQSTLKRYWGPVRRTVVLYFLRSPIDDPMKWKTSLDCGNP